MKAAKLTGAAVGLAFAFATSLAFGQAWPAKPVTIVVPTTAGSGLDIIARFLGDGLRSRTGQPFIVENRAGANAAIGAQHVARSAPDGYTVLVGTASSHAINPFTIKNLGYDPVKDFQPVTTIFAIGLVLISNPKTLPVNNIQELIAHLKSRPGQLSYGSGNAFGMITAEWFKQVAQVDVVHIPYKGVPQALTDIMSGQVHFMFADATAGLNAAQAGKVRALAVTNPKRVASAPDIPTMAESGLPGFVSHSWVGLFYPANTPIDIARRLAEASNAIMTSDKGREYLRKAGAEPYPSSPEVLRKFVEEELVKWGRVAKAAKIQPE
jgi:tripartite-type tricarboxylate transporter receptor subunit TctC